MTQGSTPGRYLPMSRRVRPNAQSASAADDHDRRDDDPDRVEDAGHRLAEVLVERQVEDPLGQLERRAQGVDEQRRDDQDGRHPGRQRRPDEPADREPDPGERGRGAARGCRCRRPARPTSPPWRADRDRR